MVKKCLLKRFGILDVNKYVEYRIHPNPEFLYVHFGNDWHTVSKEDVLLQEGVLNVLVREIKPLVFGLVM